MSYTYPAPPARPTTDLTAVEVHNLMKSPAALARRVRQLADQKFIADFLLKGRYIAQGGAILYETGEEIFPSDAPESVAPGGAFPKSVLTSGELAAAKTKKWGRDYPVTDEAISRMLRNPVDVALNKGTNGMVQFVDSVALGVIGSKVTGSFAGGSWAEADRIIEDVLLAKATHEESNAGEGYNLDVAVLKPTQYAKVMARLLNAGILPREAANPINTGDFPNYLGLTWTTSTHVPFTDPFLVDTENLGGMADEDIQSPGYGSAGPVNVKSIRDEDHEKYDVRVRRVTVPVVREPNAGIRITGTGV
ncbi:hypothetical protein ACIOWF_06775 [Cellulosimicrobium cellulans]|uniref:phage major capsid protein n=1 Tax=Cellulosimicrobium cellulans TaxID=1710 RepID=UPI00380B6B66